jgi:hypothetical protein
VYVSGAVVVKSETVVSMSQNNLQEIMASPELLEEFEQFLVSELSVENLLFLKDVQAWKRAFTGVAPTARVARARRLWRAYLAPNANFEINVSDRVSKAVRDVVGDTKAPSDVKMSLFDDAMHQLEGLLSGGPVLRFHYMREQSS